MTTTMHMKAEKGLKKWSFCWWCRWLFLLCFVDDGLPKRLDGCVYCLCVYSLWGSLLSGIIFLLCIMMILCNDHVMMMTAVYIFRAESEKGDVKRRNDNDNGSQQQSWNDTADRKKETFLFIITASIASIKTTFASFTCFPWVWNGCIYCICTNDESLTVVGNKGFCSYSGTFRLFFSSLQLISFLQALNSFN